MFTGLIEEIGTVLWIRGSERGTQLQISAPKLASESAEGDSVAVNGCCLTVTAQQEDLLTFDLLEETLTRTNLRNLCPNDPVNLEPALAASGRIGGHFVQGHIDCAARVIAWEESGADCRLEVELPVEFTPYVASKGSIAINGVSLTVAEVKAETFAVWIIPHTRRHTNLSATTAGAFVNLEFDLLAKYTERILARSASQT
ncbi:MAG: riboflavin synthase [Chthoniobacterales bacterium]